MTVYYQHHLLIADSLADIYPHPFVQTLYPAHISPQILVRWYHTPTPSVDEHTNHFEILVQTCPHKQAIHVASGHLAVAVFHQHGDFHSCSYHPRCFGVVVGVGGCRWVDKVEVGVGRLDHPHCVLALALDSVRASREWVLL